MSVSQDWLLYPFLAPYIEGLEFPLFAALREFSLAAMEEGGPAAFGLFQYVVGLSYGSLTRLPEIRQPAGKTSTDKAPLPQNCVRRCRAKVCPEEIYAQVPANVLCWRCRNSREFAWACREWVCRAPDPTVGDRSRKVP